MDYGAIPSLVAARALITSHGGSGSADRGMLCPIPSFHMPYYYYYILNIRKGCVENTVFQFTMRATLS